MIQQVNLYTDELRPSKERLQAGTAVGVLLFITFCNLTQ